VDIFVQQLINGLILGSIYALIALGYTMVYGIINLINFAHGEVLMVGALTSWSIIGLMQDAMPGTPGWLILLVALALTIERLYRLRYLHRGRHAVYPAIALVRLLWLSLGSPRAAHDTS